jgi:hypothetical protein
MFVVGGVRGVGEVFIGVRLLILFAVQNRIQSARAYEG